MALHARLQWEESEHQQLASCAQLSSTSQGRQHPEPVDVFQPEFQRDCDRITAAHSFRHLDGKSHRIIGKNPPVIRTHLALAIEAARLARTLVRPLGLNEDLAAAAAFGRFLGKTPFGQAGENTLAGLMKDHGGFSVPQQSLRLVDELEMPFPEFNGLNLSWEVRQGIDPAPFREPLRNLQPSLEGQAAETAGDLVILVRDLEDGLIHGLIEEDAPAFLALWQGPPAAFCKKYSRMDPARRASGAIHVLLEHLKDLLCQQAAVTIEEAGLRDAVAARNLPRRLLAFDVDTTAHLQNAREFVQERIVRHEAVLGLQQRATLALQALFRFYHQHPHLIGERAALRIKKEGQARAVCDFLAGMSDTAVLHAYERHLGTDNLLAELAPTRRAA